MTNKELLEKIAHLEAELAEVKEKAEAMKRTDDGGVFKPENGQEYWFISGSGEVYREVWYHHNYYEIGNCFPTKKSAKDTVQVRKLIQKARESQGGFVPDWDDETQSKYSLRLKFGNIGIENCPLINTASMLGYWRDKSACDEFITNNYDELVWFFKEYQR